MKKVVGPHLRIMRPWRIYMRTDPRAYRAPQNVYPIVQDITYYGHNNYRATHLTIEVSWNTDIRLTFDAFNHTRNWKKSLWAMMSKRHG